ncbi:MAG: hypothetical protein JNM88_12545, partial [Chitinophagaceae bacterium]|nr:hypothetical protein [Chitinophagaceae bacterium]
TASGYEVLTVTHYDDYANLPAGLSSSYLSTWNGYFSATSNTAWPYPQLPQQSQATKGKVTWTQTKVLGSSTMLNTVMIYDERGRVIQAKSTNFSGGTDVATTQYSWAGQPLVTVMKTEKAGSSAQTTVAVTKLTYDDIGRLTKTEKKVSNTNVNGGAMPAYKTIAENEYDKQGQLKKKKLAPAHNSGAGLETLNYEYNIRGWMLGMNRDYARDASSSNYFGFDLGYDKASNNLIGGQTYANPQYNGNIEGMVWKSKGDGEKRRYDFYYDAANRLLRGDFTQYTGGSFNQTAGVNYNMKMGDGINVTSAYDDNGNIKRMQQWGLKLTGSVQIDDLAYSYEYISNKLKRVTDTYTDPTTKLGDFKDGTNTGTDDYSYDVNGNLVSDNNKNISSITYNHLNLPSVISVTGKGTITYTYDAAGNKLQKTTVDNTVTPARTTTMLYMGGAVYENDALQFIGHEEGRIRYKAAEGANPASLQYDYMLKDHLGNVRMVLTEEQKTDAYPAASMETAQATTEEALYANLPQTRTNKPAGYPTDTYTNPNDKVAKVRGDGSKIGPAIPLKVMAGDKFNLRVNSWYKLNGATPGTPVNPLNDLIAAMAGGIGNISGTHGGATVAEITSSGVLTPGTTSFLGSQDYNTSRPKAFVNWIFVDEQLKYNTGGFEQVGGDQEFKTHLFTDIPVGKNGYLYIYVSNETPNVDVFFDNLQVTHTRGPILEETHYYPFGGKLAGISSQALNAGGNDNNCGCPNKKGFNGNEIQNKVFSDGSGLEFYDFNARIYDQQIGRFLEIDPLTDEGEQEKLSSYHFSYNNPVRYNDPDGKCPRCPWIFRAIKGYLNTPDVSITQTGGNNYRTGNVNLTNRTTGRTVTNYTSQPIINDPRVTVQTKKKIGGLQVVQIVNGSPLPGGKTPDGTPVQQMQIGGQTRSAFVDGGRNSPSGEQVPGKPYYNSSADLSDKNYANASTESWGGSLPLTKSSITAFDVPTAANLHTELKFETYFVATNYNGTGKDKIVGRIDWGYTKDPATGALISIGTPTLVSTNQFSPTAEAIIKNDYPKYSTTR